VLILHLVAPFKTIKLVSLEVDRNMLSLFFNPTHSHDALNKWSVTLVKITFKQLLKQWHV